MDTHKTYTTRKDINEAIRHACEANGCPQLAKAITWEWNGRFTRRMGDANILTFKIRLSKPLWKRATPEERYQTVVHEACHVIATHLHGRLIGAHGYQWQSTMLKAGVSPDRCHNVDRTGLERKQKRVPAICGCNNPNRTIGPRRAAKIRRFEAVYRCNACKCEVRLKG